MHSSSRKEHSGEDGTRCTLASRDLLDPKLPGDCSFNKPLLRVKVLGAGLLRIPTGRHLSCSGVGAGLSLECRRKVRGCVGGDTELLSML